MQAKMRIDNSFMPHTSKLIFGENAVPLEVIYDIRNAIMHFNVAFNNRKLMKRSYGYILQSFESLMGAIIHDIGFLGDNPNEIVEKFRRDVSKCYEKIKSENVTRIILGNLPKHFSFRVSIPADDHTTKQANKLDRGIIFDGKTKKDLRKEFLILHGKVNKKSRYRIGFEFSGLLSTGSGPVMRVGGSKDDYNLNIDMFVKTGVGDDKVFSDVYGLIKKYAKHTDAVVLSGETIRINVCEKGHKYFYSISLRRFATRKIISKKK